MDPLTFLVRLPFLPLQGVIQLGELIQDETERQLHDPARVRRQLEEVEQARLRGAASDQDVARVEEEAVGRLVGSGSRPDRLRR
jgi:Gas vesicle protein G